MALCLPVYLHVTIQEQLKGVLLNFILGIVITARRHFSILKEIGRRKRTLYLEKHIRFCLHLERNSINMWTIEFFKEKF
jgi:hypothetical protein